MSGHCDVGCLVFLLTDLSSLEVVAWLRLCVHNDTDKHPVSDACVTSVLCGCGWVGLCGGEGEKSWLELQGSCPE